MFGCCEDEEATKEASEMDGSTLGPGQDGKSGAYYITGRLKNVM